MKAPNWYRTATTQNNEAPSANGTAVTRERIFVVNWGGPTGGAVNNSGTATGGRSPGLPRNLYTGSGMGDVDLRLSRDFSITERPKLSILGDAFNLFNHTNVFTVNTQQYTYTAAGTGTCAGHANGCLVPVSSFLTPSATNNNLFGARELQISGRITF